MPKLTIDGHEVEVPVGSKILEAAGKLGIEVPTLCYYEGCEPFTSCMVCVVEEKNSGRLLPSCSAPVEEGMVVETCSDRVHEARKVTLELLLSEHVGDCEAPCQRVCPAGLDIPEMIRQIMAGQMEEAIVTVKDKIALPAILGYVCSAPCEKGCRRSKYDSPASICLLKRHVAATDLATQSPYKPERKPATGKIIGIIGSGPTGLAAAYYLLEAGHSCKIYERRHEPGGMLRYETPESELPREVLDAEIDIIKELGAEFHLDIEVGKDISLDEWRQEFDAVILATGKIDEEASSLLDVKYAKRGVKINPRTFETSIKNIFAGGDAVNPRRMAVVSVADGRLLAGAVGRALAGEKIESARKRFSVQIGALQKDEMADMVSQVSDAPRATPTAGFIGGLNPAEAMAEAFRCLNCGCDKRDSCKLRFYAEEYGAKAKRYKSSERPKVEFISQQGDIVFEPGKCIKCGLCVQITASNDETLGLSFIGRGFDVRVSAPFGKDFADGLQKVAAECIAACPVGAIVRKKA